MELISASLLAKGGFSRLKVSGAAGLPIPPPPSRLQTTAPYS